MRHISRTVWLVALAVMTGGWLSAAEPVDHQLMATAHRIHDAAIVLDSHIDTPMRLTGRGSDIARRTPDGEVDLVRMKEGGLDGAFFAVFIGNPYDDQHPSRRALETLDAIHRLAETHPDLAEIALDANDIRRIHASGKRIILIGMENGGPVEDSLALLRDYYRLGVRYITLTHSGNNQICDSATGGTPRWHGLSPFGKDVVREMNRLGMIIDVSHISDEAFRDVLALSTAPVIASHSCCRALCNSPRNLTDDMMRELAARGGVVQVNFYSGFLSDEYSRASAATRQRLAPQIATLKARYKDNEAEYYNRLMELWRREGPPPPGIDVLMDHIDHAVRVAGIDHVGLGSDFDGASSYPRGLEDVTGYPLITYHLLKRGYSEEDIRKILGGNLIRVMEAVQRQASTRQH